MSPPALLAVGRIARAHGLKGELRVHLYDPDSDALASVTSIVVGGIARTIERARPTTDAVLVLLVGISDRDAAEALRGLEVEVDRALLDLDEDEFFVGDLVGCEVVTVDGAPLGVVAAVLPGRQDLLELHDAAAGVSRLIPLVPEFLVEVDLDARRVTVDTPEGLPTEPLRP